MTRHRQGFYIAASRPQKTPTKTTAEEEIKKEIRKDHVGQFLKEKREYQAVSKACFDFVVSLMTSTTKRRISSYKDFKEIETKQILVGGRSLRTLLTLAWQDLFAGVCPLLAIAGAIAEFTSLAMKNGGDYDKHFDNVHGKTDAMENVGGAIVTKESLKVVLTERGLSLTRPDESLDVKEMMTVIAGAGKMVNASIALHQVKEGKPGFFAHKVNTQIESSTLDLSRKISNFEWRSSRSPPMERKGFQWRVVTSTW